MNGSHPLLVSVESAAEMLGVGRTTMFALIKSGEVPSVLIGRSRRVSVVALQQYVAALTASATDAGDQAA
jgi:excisionase family DNA binding protein